MRQQNINEISHNIKKLGKLKKNEEIFKISIKIPFSFGWIERVNLSIINSNKENLYQLMHIENKDDYAYFETIVKLQTSAIYHYHFSFEANGKFRYYKKNNITGNNSITKEECWKMSVGFKVPDWAKGANMYHIFIDRFNKSKNKFMNTMPKRTIHKNWNEPPIIGPDSYGNWNTDFYGGDLLGITQALPYLKSLSIDIIYLSPICMSQSNHRFDTGDYETVDPYAGTNSDLKNLCKSAHNLGMKVVLDAVFNHTGNDSKYFNEFRK